MPNGDGTYTALLGDPRNDENVMIAGLHCAHILFYNRVLDELSEYRPGPLPGRSGYREDRANHYVAFLIARQVTLWHYQWLLVNEHLPQIAGQQMVNDVLQNGNRFYNPPPGDAFMPIEFGAAAYRFGHSMVRPSYRANFTSGTGDSTSPTADPFFALVFDKNEPDFSDPVDYDRDDLLGRLSRRRVATSAGRRSSTSATGNVKNNKKIDTTISSVLFTLPVPAIAPHTQTSPTVLPQRNLLRQLTWGLPSGQAIARAMRVAGARVQPTCPTSPSVYAPFAASTPLWYYILAEAKAIDDGLNLGPVGGTNRHRDADRAAPRRPHQLPQRLSPLPAVPRHRPPARFEPQPQHHRQPHLHPRALPLLRRRRHTRHLPLRQSDRHRAGARHRGGRPCHLRGLAGGELRRLGLRPPVPRGRA